MRQVIKGMFCQVGFDSSSHLVPLCLKAALRRWNFKNFVDRKQGGRYLTIGLNMEDWEKKVG